MPSKDISYATYNSIHNNIYSTNPVDIQPIQISEEDSKLQRSRLEELAYKNVLSSGENGVFPLFYSTYLGFNDRNISQSIASIYRQNVDSLNYIAPHCYKKKNNKYKLKVGFISSHFHHKNHTINRLFSAYIKNLSRKKYHIISINVGKKKDVNKPINWSNNFINLNTESSILSHQKSIANLELDILIYLDISMCPSTYKLAFTRLAPVQILTWGHPVTSGLDTIDYFFSSKYYERDDAQTHYTEKLITADSLTCTVSPPHMYSSWSRSDFGLSEIDNLYLCPQSLFKIQPLFDEIFIEILRQDPKGIILLISGEKKAWNLKIIDRISSKDSSIVNRIKFLRRLDSKNFVRLLKLSDCILDPITFGGGITSLEALYVGTPIITLPGNYLRSRLTQGFYKKIGIQDFIVNSKEEYIDLALSLVKSKEYNYECRKKILEKSKLLFQDMDSVTDLEFLLDNVN